MRCESKRKVQSRHWAINKAPFLHFLLHFRLFLFNWLRAFLFLTLFTCTLIEHQEWAFDCRFVWQYTTQIIHFIYTTDIHLLRRSFTYISFLCSAFLLSRLSRFWQWNEMKWNALNSVWQQKRNRIKLSNYYCSTTHSIL